MNSTKYQFLKRRITTVVPINDIECILKRRYDYQISETMKRYQQKTDERQIVIQYELI